MSTTFSTIQTIATIDTSGYKRGVKEIENANSGIEKSSDVTSKKSNVAFNSIAKVGLAGIATAAIAVGVVITKNIGNAIKRVDTLIAFPRLLQTLGATSEEAEASTDRLKTALQGLPTSLDQGARGVQRLITAGTDVDKATEAFLGLNNAILASGGDMAQAESLFLQLSQSISRGTIEGQEWNTIAANLPTVLQALQNETGKTKNELEEMFKADPQALLDNIIRLNKEGGGGIASLETQARQATGGIGTAFANLDNAVTRGIEGIVRALGNGDLEAGQLVISNGINNIGKAFETTLRFAGEFFAFMITNKDIFAPIILAMTTMITLLTAWFIATKVLTAAQLIFNAVLSANPIGLIIVGIAALVVAFLYLWNNVEGFKNFFVKAWAIILGAIKGVFNWVKNNWPLILAIIAGPIGLAVAMVIKNFDKIKEAAVSVYNWIKNTFSTIGEIGASIVKGAVNSVLGFAERTINGFINMINGALDAINKIPGVSIGAIGNLSVPKLAQGGIITSPTLAMVGEGREAEAVIPLSKLDKMLGESRSGNGSADIEVTNNIFNEVDMDRAMRDLAWRIAY